MHAPGLEWRGATSAPFPGYMLIGRGPDFANTLTSPGTDIIDQYAETLCNGSDEMYLYKGECLPMEHFDAGSLGGQEVTFLRTVHGPVVGYATVDGERVAISSKRSSYGKEILDQLFFRRLSTGAVHSPKTFFKAASLTPQTFNSFYIDNKHIAEYTSGLLPKRPEERRSGPPDARTGQYEWTGFCRPRSTPTGPTPRTARSSTGTTTSPSASAPPTRTGVATVSPRGSTCSTATSTGCCRRTASGLSPAVTSAMNAAATQDIRAIDMVPLLAKLLRHSQAPSPLAQQMLDLMVAWRANGGSRLDRDLDGLIDDPGAAIMDAA